MLCMPGILQGNEVLRIAAPHIVLEHGRQVPTLARRNAVVELTDRERGQLARMSEAELHDIGVTPAERWAEINKPRWRG